MCGAAEFSTVMFFGSSAPVLDRSLSHSPSHFHTFARPLPKICCYCVVLLFILDFFCMKFRKVIHIRGFVSSSFDLQSGGFLGRGLHKPAGVPNGYPDTGEVCPATSRLCPARILAKPELLVSTSSATLPVHYFLDNAYIHPFAFLSIGHHVSRSVDPLLT